MNLVDLKQEKVAHLEKLVEALTEEMWDVNPKQDVLIGQLDKSLKVIEQLRIDKF